MLHRHAVIEPKGVIARGFSRFSRPGFGGVGCWYSDEHALRRKAIGLVFRALAAGQTPAGDAGANPELAEVLKRLSNPLAGGDKIGAIGAVDVAALAEATGRNGTKLALRNSRRFWDFIWICHGDDGRS